MQVIHSPFWNKMLGPPDTGPEPGDEPADVYDPDPGPEPTFCEGCGPLYAIEVPVGGCTRKLCGICYGRHLAIIRDAQRKRQQRKREATAAA